MICVRIVIANNSESFLPPSHKKVTQARRDLLNREREPANGFHWAWIRRGEHE
jgi:hypothetical protein